MKYVAYYQCSITGLWKRSPHIAAPKDAHTLAMLKRNGEAEGEYDSANYQRYSWQTKLPPNMRPCKWIVNTPFEDVVEILRDGYSKNVTVKLLSTGEEVYMGVSNLIDNIDQVNGGLISGYWKWCKTGGSYVKLKYLGKDKP